MPLPPPPPKWASDELTKFFDAARNNAFATFANRSDEVRRLIDIEAAIRKLALNLDHSKDWFAALFVLRAHSAWLAAAQLALSAQTFETAVMLRASLESALYGFRIARNPHLREIWLRRGEGRNERSQVKKEFSFRHLIDGLASEDQRESTAAEALYEQCIDFGAHPNEAGYMGNQKMEEDNGQIRFEVAYQNASPLALGLALRTTARIGVCILGIFRLIFRERCDILGISELLPRLRHGL
jgi:hypothetical protein